jgi:hypothetical protein
MDFRQAVPNIGGALLAQIAGFNDQVVKFSGTTTLSYIPIGYEGFQLSQLKFVMCFYRSISKHLGNATPSEGCWFEPSY